MVGVLALDAYFFTLHPDDHGQGLLPQEEVSVVAPGTGQIHKFKVEIAKTEQQQSIGLMFRKQVPEGTGMLFLWPTARPVAFWMKNTIVPLDMLFISSDDRISGEKRDAMPESTSIIPSGGPVIGVMELPAGDITRDHLQIGDRVHGIH